jgi:hypothetical protein
VVLKKERRVRRHCIFDNGPDLFAKVWRQNPTVAIGKVVMCDGRQDVNKFTDDSPIVASRQ